MADPTKFELSGHCSALLAIIESKEDAGQDRGGLIAREYTKCYHLLMDIVRKEHEEDEARKRNPQRKRLDEG